MFSDKMLECISGPVDCLLGPGPGAQGVEELIPNFYKLTEMQHSHKETQMTTKRQKTAAVSQHNYKETKMTTGDTKWPQRDGK